MQDEKDEKDRLRAELTALVNIPPKSLGSAGVIATRAWMERMATACKVLKSERSSVHALRSAISSMQPAAAANQGNT